MRTRIVIDDELLARAKELSGLKSTTAVVDEALRRYISLSEQARAWDELKGLADWEGDLEEMRKDRDLPAW